MKIVTISTFQEGGAGRAAMRLHEGLLANGVNSKFLCAYPKNLRPEVQIAKPNSDSYIKKAFLKIGLKSIDRFQYEMKKVRQAGGNYEYYSLPFSNYKLEEHPSVREADVIHLHWVANFINFPTFFRTKKPIVWTFHDMNPILGGFHYRGDLDRNSGNDSLMGLEKIYKHIKEDALKDQLINVCTLSSWIYNESKADKIMSRFPHHNIPNGLHTEVFKIYPKNLAREVFNISINKKVFLFICGNIQNKRKGFSFLEEAFGKIRQRDDLILIVVGANPPLNYQRNIFFFEPIYDERLLALLFSSADACIVPSSEDNLPNIMLEALSCGLPVIGFPTGGLKDVIINDFNGIICNDVSSDSLAVSMEKFFELEFDPLAIRNDSVKKYDLSVQAKNYIALYDSILEK